MICRTFSSALGRTRTCDLLIRSQTRLRTGGDREGHRETKIARLSILSFSKGTGTDKERHGVMVPLWYERRAVFWDTSFSETWGTKRVEAVRRPANL